MWTKKGVFTQYNDQNSSVQYVLYRILCEKFSKKVQSEL